MGETPKAGTSGAAFRPQGKVLPADARRYNRSLIIQQLLRNGEMARADLARVTQLTAATVGDLVSGLLDEGIVEERGRRSAGTGKPATLLGVVSDARHMICLDLSDENQFVGGVVNLTGEVVKRRRSSRKDNTGADAVRLVAELAAKLLADTDRPVLGVGIGSPGVVYEGGIVQESSNLRWHHVTLADQLSQELEVPVHVLNDANAAVLGELQFGGWDRSNLLVVKVGLGVGAGLVLDSHLIAGDGSAAGEIGHTVVDKDGGPCSCGKRGCLETVVAGPLLHSQVEGLEDRERDQVLGSAGHHLGMALAPVISMLDLDQVLLSGPTDLLGGPFSDAARVTIRRRTYLIVGRVFEVDMTATGNDDVLLGSAARVLKQEFGVG